MEITVKAKYIKSTPRKLRLVADALKQMKVTKALDNLTFINREAATPLRKALASAVAILKEKQLEEDKFSLRSISCDQGPRLKRRLMKSRGQSTLVQKRMTHLTLTITDRVLVIDKKKSNKKTKKEDSKSIIKDSDNKQSKE